MKNIYAILRRDLNAYFTTPIGYIFMMVFVTISVGLYITSFFSFPIADMRPYFDNLPIFLCVFIPAITMRVWAEERKENTWEMLLTFPMEARELVLGKFFAALIFFALTLLATITVPAMLISLGEPDMGTIYSGYMGTLLLAGFFLALGILFSGFFKDQIVAFVVTLLTSFSFFLVGTGFIAGYIDERVPGLGSMLANLLGVFSHFGAFTRGVVDLADIVYFLVWTAIFLVLNIMYIDGRNRPGAKTLFLGAVGICITIGLLFNWLMAGQSFARFDMTEDKIHTISKASKAILAEVDTPVQIKVYITPSAKMPTGMKELERDITDKLEELRVASNGKIEFTTVHLEVNNVIAPPTPPSDDEEEETEEESIEKRMLEKGVQPFSVSARSNDEISNKLVYSSIGIAYKDKAEEVLPNVMPQNLQELEYKLVSTIYKLTRDKPPVVALVAPKEAISMDPQIRAMLMQMGQQIPQSDDPYVYLEQILDIEKYEIQRVELTKESPLPAEYDTLVIINPRRLNDRQRWEINRALHSGKSVVMAVQTYEWDYQSTNRGTTVARREEMPDVNVLLNEYGLGVSEEILMDSNRVALTVQSGGNSLMAMLQQQTLTLPMHVLVNNTSMDPDTSITGRLESIFYLWGTALDLDQEKLNELGLQAKTVMSSSERAWTVPNSDQLDPNVFTVEPPESEMSQFPLMAIIEGQFPDVYADTERPAWPAAAPPRPNQFGMPPPQPSDAPDPPSPPVTAKAGKMILIGCSEMFRKNFLRAGNLDLFLNAVDALSLSENLVNVRGQKPINRMIERPSDEDKRNWRLANYGLANVIIAGIGIGLAYKRRRSRNAYTMKWQSKN